MRKIVVTLVTVVVTTGVLGAAGASAPVSVWTDPEGDVSVNGSAIPNGSAAGVDLVAGEIARVGADLEFVVHVPMEVPWTLPEASRFMWHFDVEGRTYRLVVKSMHAGKPAEIAGGESNDGQIQTAGHYRLERCDGPVEDLGRCAWVSMDEDTRLFDFDTDTFTLRVPLAALGAKTGTVIAPGTGGSSPHGCQICWTGDVSERSPSQTILDSATQTLSYTVPKK